MQHEASTTTLARGPETGPTAFHHVGVQTVDLDNALSWYVDFLGAEVAWELTTFSELTRRRLPGIRRLAEIRLGDLRLHLIDRGAVDPPPTTTAQFQHLCLVVPDSSDLEGYRSRWSELRRSGRYTFVSDEPPTEIVVDADGIRSFYALDPDGLELELTYVPSA